MAEGNCKTTLTVAEGAEAVFVRGGIRVEFNANGGIDVYGNVPVTLHPPANENAPPVGRVAPQVGDVMPDGTIFAGVSPETNRLMFALPADAPLTMKWKDAMEYAASFEGHGHRQGAFRVPTTDELNVLFRNKARIGGFDETGSYPAGWYWSSSESRDGAVFAWAQKFDDGFRGWDLKRNESSLRLVRS